MPITWHFIDNVCKYVIIHFMHFELVKLSMFVLFCVTCFSRINSFVLQILIATKKIWQLIRRKASPAKI